MTTLASWTPPCTASGKGLFQAHSALPSMLLRAADPAMEVR